jgi:hypothetical protein
MLTRHFLTMAMAGIKNYSWYFWEGYDRLAVKLTTPCRYQFDSRLADLCSGSELDNSGAYRQITPAGSAYSEISKWLTGRRITSATFNGADKSWQVKASDGSGCYSIVWTQRNRSRLANDRGRYSEMVNLDGEKNRASNVVPISEVPLLLKQSGQCR